MNSVKIWIILVTLHQFGVNLGNGNKSDDNSPSVALTRQAIELGMDPDIFGELWRTKQPVVISKPDAQGCLCTTTYALAPGYQNIVKNTVNEKMCVQSARPPSSSLEIQPASPDHSSSPKMQPASPAPNSSPGLDPSDPQAEWEYMNTPSDSRRTYTPIRPTFKIQLPHWTDWNERNDWASFGFPVHAQPQPSTQAELEDQGRIVTTTVLREKHTSNLPGVEDTAEVLPVNRRPSTLNDPLPYWLKQPLEPSHNTPSLTPNAAIPLPVAVTRPTRLPMHPPLPTLASKEMGLEKRTTTPNPLPNDFFTQTGSQATPTYFDDLPGHFSTRVTSYSSYGTVPQNSADFGSFRQGIFNGGDITDEDIQKARSQGGYMTRTRTMPNGHVIKTTVRINSSPGPLPLPTRSTTDVFNADRSQLPNQQQNSIDSFLSQVHVTPAQIMAQNGMLVKTFVDDSGRVLSANIVLSNVKEDKHGQAELAIK